MYKNKNVDIESIFSVVDELSNDSPLENLGHTQLYLMAELTDLKNFKNKDNKPAKSLKKLIEEFIKIKVSGNIR